MKKIKNNNQAGFGIMAIIAIIAAIFGAGGVLWYVQNNQSEIEDLVAESRVERAEEAEENGYPTIWAEDNLPEYPNGELKKVREMGNVTLETNDSPAVVGNFFETELISRGFSKIGLDNNSALVSFAMYKKGTAGMSVQATVLKSSGKTKVVLLYHQ